MIRAEGISKYYRKGIDSLAAVDNVSMHIGRGEIVGFLGLNGAGKTTTIKILAGLIKPDKGTVCIDTPDGPSGLGVSALLEGHRNLYWRMTAMENLEYFAVLRGLSIKAARQQSWKLLSTFGLEDRSDEYVQKLSRGMQQRLAVCVAMVHKPKVLLLDEPTLGVDFDNTRLLIDAILSLKEQGVSILITTHQLSVAEQLSDRVAIIANGKIVADHIQPKNLNRDVKETYQLVLGDLIDKKLEKDLESYTVEVNESQIDGISEDNLYNIIELAKPRHIVSITKSEPEFEQVFLNYARNQ